MLDLLGFAWIYLDLLGFAWICLCLVLLEYTTGCLATPPPSKKNLISASKSWDPRNGAKKPSHFRRAKRAGERFSSFYYKIQSKSTREARREKESDDDYLRGGNFPGFREMEQRKPPRFRTPKTAIYHRGGVFASLPVVCQVKGSGASRSALQ